MKADLIQKVTDWAQRLAGARSAIGDLHSADVEMRQEHAGLTAERARLINAKPNKASLVAMLGDEIETLGERWATENGPGVVQALSGGVSVTPDGVVHGVTRGNLGAAFPGPIGVEMLCALVATLIRDRLAAVINATSYAEGPPLSERPRLIAEVDAKIADVEARHSELVDAAHAFDPPISLELLPDVRARRASEAHRAEVMARTAPR